MTIHLVSLYLYNELYYEVDAGIYGNCPNDITYNWSIKKILMI